MLCGGPYISGLRAQNRGPRGRKAQGWVAVLRGMMACWLIRWCIRYRIFRTVDFLWVCIDLAWKNALWVMNNDCY